MKKLAFVLLMGLLFSGCGHEDTFPDIPTLEFKKFEFGDDAGIKTFTVTATFTDGDGDIGYYLDGRPNEPIFDDESSDYYYNFVFELQVQKNGIWNDTNIFYEEIDYTDTTDLDGDTTITNFNDNSSGRLPYLTPEGQNKGLKGDIEKTAYMDYSLINDTIRFKVFIYDRALHKSNVIITPAYLVQN